MKFQGKKFGFELGKKTYIMGILNVTPDSFYDGGLYNSPAKALEQAEKMLKDGADIIDIGAQSTRPGHIPVSENDELDIIKKYLPFIFEKTGAVISVDTFFPKVAEYALDNGAAIINDVSGIFNGEMAKLVLKYNCGWIITHTRGKSSSQIGEYKNGVVEDTVEFFDDVLIKCDEFGIPRESIMFDMGIGFGKSESDNIELIKNINKIKRQDCALLTALSSKRVVANVTNTDGYDRVYGTISANTIAISGGTDMIRVHNVKENVLAAKMADALVR